MDRITMEALVDWFPTYGSAYLSKCPDALSQLEDVVKALLSRPLRSATRWCGRDLERDLGWPRQCTTTESQAPSQSPQHGELDET